ncbi:hypothetical protein FPV67DRAFT_1671897 [Lyophyllum atratum]|nr:hypothetical protein FPV67DRAFT_1671897 [Lyophyllum atratum]
MTVIFKAIDDLRGDASENSIYGSGKVDGLAPGLQRLQPEPENPELPDIAQLMTTLSTSAEDMLLIEGSGNDVQAVLNALQGKTPASDTNSIMAVDSLQFLAERCARADQTAASADFIYMLSCIALRCKVISVSCSTGEKKTIVLKKIKSTKSWKLLERYVDDGAKYTLFASAVLLQRANRITFSTLFSTTLLTSQGISSEVKASDIVHFDEFFDSIIFSYHIHLTPVDILCQTVLSTSHVPSRTEHSLYNTPFSGPSTAFIPPPPAILPAPPGPSNNFELAMQALETHTFTSDPSKLYVVETPFNPELPTNSKIKFSPKNKKKRYRYTQRQRICPGGCNQVPQRLPGEGVKTDGKAYVKLSHDNLEGCRLRVNDKHGNPMVIVIPDMPEHIRDPLLDKLSMIQPGVLRYTDSVLGESGKFCLTHFAWWNRYHVSGKGAPSDIDPAALKRQGKKHYSTAQCTPRTSMELQKNIQAYKQLQIALASLFE